MEKLDEKKINKHKENEEKREKIDKIQTSIGYIKTRTRIGNLKHCAQELIYMSENKGKLPKKFLTFCDEFGEIFEYEPLDKEEILALYREIIDEYKKIDKKFLKYKTQIEKAKNSEDLERIDIEYWTIFSITLLASHLPAT